MQNNEIYLIAITGGPCGGKSTFLAKVRNWLQGFGIFSLVVSEVATRLINSGFTPESMGLEAFEEMLLVHQLQGEEERISEAEKIGGGQPVVILCDRGALDCAAYIEKEIFSKIAEKLGHSVKDLMNRYKLVVHLTTAAWGAEKFYTLENNEARTESVEKARELDLLTQQAWLGHLHHIIIDNRTDDFDAKMLRALQSLARVLKMPEPTEIERKFRFLNFDPSFIPKDAAVINITQDYLLGDKEKERRVRIAELNGQKTYFYTEKVETGECGKRYEKETVITYERYLEFYAERDPSLRTIKKIRHCFVYGGRKFELDIYQAPVSIRGLVILEVELPDINEPVEFPIGWELEDVTGVKEYKNRSLAERP